MREAALPVSPSLDGARIGDLTAGPGLTPFPPKARSRGPLPFAIGPTMTDTDHFDRLAETYSTQADHCRREAEGPLDPWALLAAAWTKLAEETKVRSRLAARP